MAVVFASFGASNAGTTSCTPGYPTGISASTSLLYALVVGRSSVADTAFTGPSGWTSLGQFEGGTGSFGVDTGTRRVAWFKKDTVTGSETGTITFSFGAGSGQSTISATIFRLEKTVNYTVTEQFGSGADTSNDTSFSATTGSLNWATGDLLCIGVCQNIDTGTVSSPSITATGVTFGTLSARIDQALTTGNDHRRLAYTVPVSSASTSAAGTFAYTISTAGSGALGLLLVTEAPTDVTTALSGQEIVSGLGLLERARTSGQEITSGQGSATAGVSLSLTGGAITSAQGIATAVSGGALTLIGQGITASQQTLTAGLGQAITGEASTGGQGSVSVGSNPSTNAGQSLTASAGTMTPSGNSLTLNITGEEFTAYQGFVDSGGQPITGSATTSAQGSPALDLSLPLTGIETTSAAGTITPEQDAVDTLATAYAGTAGVDLQIALTGSESTSGQGSVAVTGDADVALTGEESTVSDGSVGFDFSFPLSGVSITSAQENMGAPGGATLTGSSITVTAGEIFVTNDRTFALTGESTTVQAGSCFASPLAFVDGQSLTVSQQDIGPRGVALTGSAMTADAGYLLVPARGVVPAGNPVKKGRKRTTVVIDNEEFEVSGPEEALALLEQAKEAAREQASIVLDRASKAEKKPGRKVLQDARKSLTTPVIEGPEEIQAQIDTMKREIAELYESALKTVEIGTLLRRQEEEEEEALLLLLA